MAELNRVAWRSWWPRIRAGVEEALQYQREGLFPEDVYCELKAGRAVLFANDDAFVILTEEVNAGGTRDVLVWIAKSTVHGAMQRYEAQLMQIAKDAGCVGLRFTSTRRGYERALPDGWQLQHVMWRKTWPVDTSNKVKRPCRSSR